MGDEVFDCNQLQTFPNNIQNLMQDRQEIVPKCLAPKSTHRHIVHVRIYKTPYSYSFISESNRFQLKYVDGRYAD